jgi:ribosome-associated protein
MNTVLLRASIRAKGKLQFSRSGGPGGQNVNKVNSKVSLRIHLPDLAGLSDAEMDRLRLCLASRITGDDELIIHSSEERSQKTNRERALCRAEIQIAAAARLPKCRKALNPGRGAKETRLRSKRLQSQKKARRRLDPVTLV